MNPLFGVDLIVGLIDELLARISGGDLKANVPTFALAKVFDLNGRGFQIETAAGTTRGGSIRIAEHPIIQYATIVLLGLIEEQTLLDAMQLSILDGTLQCQMTRWQISIGTIDEELVGKHLLGLILAQLLLLLMLANVVELLIILRLLKGLLLLLGATKGLVTVQG